MTAHRLVLHEHPFASFCQKPLVALYELGLPFEARIVEGDRSEIAALWPPAKIPILVDETAGLMLPESTTIIEYLNGLAGTPQLLGADPLQTRLWDRFHDQYVAVPMQKIVADSLRPEGREDPEGVNEARRTLDTAYRVLDGQLADKAWTAGEAFTLADCAAAPALFYARVLHRWDDGERPNLARYYRDLRKRESVTRVIEEARPYRELFPLPWTADVDVY
jgi:glutathione S-transferase